MEELFGVPMDVIMGVLLATFLGTMALIGVLALRNRIMLKLGLRNIPRRRAQTILIIIGIMLSSVITAAAFGTGDTINFSIRHEAVEALGPIDEVIVRARVTVDDSFGSQSYFPMDRFLDLREELAGLETIDGLTAGIGEEVPAINSGTLLSEGRMRVTGIDPASLGGFGGLTSTSGKDVRVEDLGDGEAYINVKAAEELEAGVDDEVLLFLGGGTEAFKVRAVVERGGLAGPDSTLAISLERAQRLFGRAGQVNSIVVSNLGDELEGADFSEEVTRRLRVLFGDREIAGRLKELLGAEEALGALEERGASLEGGLRTDLASLRDELSKDGVSDELVSLLADEEMESEVLEALEGNGLVQQEREANTLFSELGEFRVFEVKRRALEEADEVASGVTTAFIVLGLFSIMVGVLLIFLIFVMLAAARKSEMGMARAVGARRGHLVQMFLFEGTSYALVAAAVGVPVGLGVSALIVVVANQFIGAFEEDLRFIHHFEIRSMILRFSAYRVSRLNISTSDRESMRFALLWVRFALA